MSEVLSELLSLLRLEPIEKTIFRGPSQDLGWGAVFGGQVLGQALSAAEQTVPDDRACHSLHGYFLRQGDVNADIVYLVDPIRDGRSFHTRRVVAMQHGKAIFNMAASFHCAEEGFDHQDDMPRLVGPEGLSSNRELAEEWASRLPPPLKAMATAERPIEIRPVEPVNPLKPSPRPPHRVFWMKTSGPLPDDPAVHRHLLAYASDFNFLTTALGPHGVTWLTRGMQVASLDHAMWFHRPFRMDEWLLYDVESPSASGALGMARGRVFDRKGRLVATVAQEGLIRDRRSPEQKERQAARQKPSPKPSAPSSAPVPPAEPPSFSSRIVRLLERRRSGDGMATLELMNLAQRGDAEALQALKVPDDAPLPTTRGAEPSKPAPEAASAPHTPELHKPAPPLDPVRALLDQAGGHRRALSEVGLEATLQALAEVLRDEHASPVALDNLFAAVEQLRGQASLLVSELAAEADRVRVLNGRVIIEVTLNAVRALGQLELEPTAYEMALRRFHDHWYEGVSDAADQDLRALGAQLEPGRWSDCPLPTATREALAVQGLGWRGLPAQRSLDGRELQPVHAAVAFGIRWPQEMVQGGQTLRFALGRELLSPQGRSLLSFARAGGRHWTLDLADASSDPVLHTVQGDSVREAGRLRAFIATLTPLA